MKTWISKAVYPRECGAASLNMYMQRLDEGLSPRVRGSQHGRL